MGAEEGVVVVSTTDHAVLWAEVNEGHRAAVSHAETALARAIRVGELLSTLRVGVKWGEWSRVLRENFEGSETSAHYYMRLHAYRDQIPGDVRTYKGAISAVAGLVSAEVDEHKSWKATRAQEAREMRAGGKSLAAIGREFKVSKQTVRRWTDEAAVRDARERQRQRNARLKEQRAEAKAAAAALRRERTVKAAKAAGGPLAETYSLVRKACQQADHAHGQAEGEAKRALTLALEALHKAEDEITRALGVS